MRKGIFSLVNIFYVSLICIILSLFRLNHYYFILLFIILFSIYFIRKYGSILIPEKELETSSFSIYEEGMIGNIIENKAININMNTNFNKNRISLSYLEVENNSLNFQDGDFYERRNKILKRLFFKLNDSDYYDNEFNLRKEKQIKYSRQAREANIEAEESIQNLYELEIDRNRVIVEAMFKLGKACNYNLIMISRNLLLRTKKIMRKIQN